jgi:hypothetical protein
VSNILDSTADKTKSVIHDEIKRKEANSAEFKEMTDEKLKWEQEKARIQHIT